MVSRSICFKEEEKLFKSSKQSVLSKNCVIDKGILLTKMLYAKWNHILIVKPCLFTITANTVYYDSITRNNN